MCTFYRISYIYLMHLPMNANRFSSSWIKIQSNWEIGAGCSGYIIVCKAAVYKVNSNCFLLLFLNWRSLARVKYTDHHLVTLHNIKENNKVPWEIKIMFLDTLDFLQTRDNPSTTPLKVKFLHFFAYSCKTLGFCNSDKVFLWNKILIFFFMKTGLTWWFRRGIAW